MGLPTARGVQGCNLEPPEKGLFEAAPGSLPLCETVKLLERAQRLWHVGGEVALVSLQWAGRERSQAQGDTVAGRWGMPGIWHGAAHAGPHLG